MPRENGESRMDAMEAVLEGEASMSGDDRVEIREQIVEKIQIYQMSEVGKARQCGAQERRVPTCGSNTEQLS